VLEADNGVVVGSFLVIRDHMGITPLYMGYGTDGSIWFASEMKVGTRRRLCVSSEHSWLG
jgi:asparagine synthetase B (glutamine-hydrolysing)